MKIHRSLPLGVLSILIGLGATGCTTGSGGPGVGDTSFIDYEGKQSRWPTAENALVDRDLPVPVYRGLPPRPYIIVGRIVGTQHNVVGRTLAENLWTDRDRLRDSCAQARIRGADAVLLTDDPQIMEAFHVPRGEAGELERPVYNFAGAVVAIRWGNP